MITSLTKEEEFSLVERMKKGDIDARNKLVEQVIFLAKNLAQKYCKYDVEDHLQEALLSLILGIERFDPNKGRLSTYATIYLKKGIFESKHYNSLIRVPRSTFQAGRAEKVDTCHLSEIVASKLFAPGEEEVEPLPKLDTLIEKLDKADQKLIKLRLQMYTLSQIGDIYGVTKERVRQKLEKIYEKIRNS